MPRTIPDMTIGNKLRAILDDRRLKVTDLSPAVPHVSKSTLCNWVRGDTCPGVESALALARFLTVPLEWLADDAQDYPPPSEAADAPDRDMEGILWTVRQIGVEEAARRLLADPAERAQPPQSVPMPEPGHYLDPEELEKVRRGAYRNNVSAPAGTPAPAPKRRKGHR